VRAGWEECRVIATRFTTVDKIVGHRIARKRLLHLHRQLLISFVFLFWRGNALKNGMERQGEGQNRRFAPL